MFGVKPCSIADWTSLLIFIIICFFLSWYSLRMLQREQFLKLNFGQGLVKPDIRVIGTDLIKVVLISFIGGLVSSSVGLGGGAIFNPMLLSLGIPPAVASATGMYMIIFSTAASTLSFILNGQLNVPYGLWIGFFCIVGSMMGMRVMKKVMKNLGRQSPQVMLLCFVLFISAVAVFVFGIVDTVQKGQNLY